MSTETLSSFPTISNAATLSTDSLVGLVSTNGSTFSNARWLFTQLDLRWLKSSVITTAGDILVGSGAGTYARLGIGTAGQVIGISGGSVAWVNPSAGSLPLLTGSDPAAVLENASNVPIIGTNSTGNLAIGATGGGYVLLNSPLRNAADPQVVLKNSAGTTLLDTGSGGALQANGFITTALTVGSLAYPSTDGSAGQAVATDGAGNLAMGGTSTKTASALVLRDASGNAALGLTGFLNGTTAAVTSIINGTNVSMVIAAGVLTVSASGGGGGGSPGGTTGQYQSNDGAGGFTANDQLYISSNIVVVGSGTTGGSGKSVVGYSTGANNTTVFIGGGASDGGAGVPTIWIGASNQGVSAGHPSVIKIGFDGSDHLGFFGATPVGPQSLTDSTGGTPGSSLAPVSGTLDDADINNNFATIYAALHAYGLI